jgi:hypothetical protein
LISCKFGRAVLSRSWRQRSRSLPTRLANKPFGLNGSGISSASLEKSEGFGLRNMHTRASDADAVQRLQALEDFKFLRAPFDGVVINRSTDIGDLIVSGSGKTAPISWNSTYLTHQTNCGPVLTPWCISSSKASDAAS